MPTASTSQILGNNESFEPYTSNVYTRRVLAGEFVCMNPHLVADLIELGLWTSDVKNALLALNGSVQQIKAIPKHIKDLYKTVWEIPQKCLLNLAVARGPYICQSQSLNVYMPEANFAKMTSMHFHAWKRGLKTGQYYLRTRPSRDAIKFTVNIEQLLQATDAGNNEEIIKCLTLNSNNMKSLAASPVPNVPEALRRDSRLISTSSMPDDDHGNGFHKPTSVPIPEQQEVEEVTFECINCSG
jgi:ribonucleotide reductase alpha subunit